MTKLSFLGKFIVYGIGIKTEYLIRVYDKQIVGLMDRVKAGAVIYGKRVLYDAEVVQSGVRAIVIAARQANIPIIYRRIEAFCRENGISVYDMDGKRVAEQASAKPLDFSIDNIDEAKKRIDKADVVSFDVFDTLTMRACLYPEDVFEIAGTSDTVEEYEKILEAEYKLSRVRREMADLYGYAVSKHKQIYFVSDMYLRARDISRILRMCGIHAKPDRVLVSGDYGVSKMDGLFDRLKDRCSHKSILHIGDSLEADYLSAIKYGIGSIKISNRLEKLENSEKNCILKFDTTLENRLVIGQLLASDLRLADFIAPLIYKFVCWLREKSKEFDIILLGARDGWLIREIIRKFPQYNIPAIYFLTSRTAAVSAGTFDRRDISDIKKYPFSGGNRLLYENRFAAGDCMDDDALLVHTTRLRNNYLKYIYNLNIPSGAKAGFMDFVSAGTCYRALKRFAPFEMKGLFAVHLCAGSDEIETLYAEPGQTEIMKNYFLIEEILSSDDPTLKCFDDSGQPYFFEEKRTNRQISELRQIREEILRYGEQAGDIDFSKVDLGLCDSIFGMAKQTAISAEDEFCGR